MYVWLRIYVFVMLYISDQTFCCQDTVFIYIDVQNVSFHIWVPYPVTSFHQRVGDRENYNCIKVYKFSYINPIPMKYRFKAIILLGQGIHQSRLWFIQRILHSQCCCWADFRREEWLNYFKTASIFIREHVNGMAFSLFLLILAKFIVAYTFALKLQKAPF